MQLRVADIMLKSGEKFETPECLIPKSNDFKWSVSCFPAIPAKQTEGNIFQIRIHVSKYPVIVMARVIIKNTTLGGSFMHNLNTLDTTPFMSIVTHKDLMASLAFKKNNFMVIVKASFVFPVVESKAVSSPQIAFRDAFLSCIQVRRRERPIADPVQNLTVAEVEEPHDGQPRAHAGF
uniref:MATH domain-containing protein n=1 Tax=Panagrellus redivivus TaxID=6233 RepID=A0A7E4ZVS4_PANRE